MKNYQIEFVVANFLDKPGQGFASTTNEVFLVAKKGKPQKLPLASKRVIAKRIIDEIVDKS